MKNAVSPVVLTRLPYRVPSLRFMAFTRAEQALLASLIECWINGGEPWISTLDDGKRVRFTLKQLRDLAETFCPFPADMADIDAEMRHDPKCRRCRRWKEVRRCAVCQCTDECGCPGGCSWAPASVCQRLLMGPDLCTLCVELVAPPSAEFVVAMAELGARHAQVEALKAELARVRTAVRAAVASHHGEAHLAGAVLNALGESGEGIQP